MKYVVSYYVTGGSNWEVPVRYESRFDTLEEARQWARTTDGWISDIQIRLVDVEKIEALEAELKELKKGVLIEG